MSGIDSDSAAMTLDTYADLFDDGIDAVSLALDRGRVAQLQIHIDPGADEIEVN